jgi:hypothetical protein
MSCATICNWVDGSGRLTSPTASCVSLGAYLRVRVTHSIAEASALLPYTDRVLPSQSHVAGWHRPAPYHFHGIKPSPMAD